MCKEAFHVFRQLCSQLELGNDRAGRTILVYVPACGNVPVSLRHSPGNGRHGGSPMKPPVSADQMAIRFARTVFTCAGIWGFVVLTPLYFSFDLVGRFYPPAITHPDFFYGFIGVAIAWQIVFLLIGRDPTG